MLPLFWAKRNTAINTSHHLSNKPYLIINQHLKDMTELCLLRGNLYKLNLTWSGSRGIWD